jgi:hypothetical protein
MSDDHVEGCYMNSLMRQTDQCICPRAMQELRERLVVAERERDRLAEALRAVLNAEEDVSICGEAEPAATCMEALANARAVLAECAGTPNNEDA